MEILCDKVLISSFFKYQISTTFSTFYDFLKFMFLMFKVTRFILFVFINKIVVVIFNNKSF